MAPRVMAHQQSEVWKDFARCRLHPAPEPPPLPPLDPAGVERWKAEWTANQRRWRQELFFPEQPSRANPEAKAFCGQCPVQAACLDYALATNQRYGVWGGKTEDERRRIRRRPRHLQLVVS